MSTTIRISKAFIFFGLALGFTSCTTFQGVHNEISVGMNAEDVLTKYGAPLKVQKVLKYEVWTYNVADTQECQLFFQKAVLTQPVKCFELPHSQVVAAR